MAPPSGRLPPAAVSVIGAEAHSGPRASGAAARPPRIRPTRIPRFAPVPQPTPTATAPGRAGDRHADTGTAGRDGL